MVVFPPKEPEGKLHGQVQDQFPNLDFEVSSVCFEAFNYWICG